MNLTMVYVVKKYLSDIKKENLNMEIGKKKCDFSPLSNTKPTTSPMFTAKQINENKEALKNLHVCLL